MQWLRSTIDYSIPIGRVANIRSVVDGGVTRAECDHAGHTGGAWTAITLLALALIFAAYCVVDAIFSIIPAMRGLPSVVCSPAWTAPPGEEHAYIAEAEAA